MADDKLRAAMEPLVKAADICDQHQADDEAVYSIAVSTLRNARAAYEALTIPTDQPGDGAEDVRKLGAIITETIQCKDGDLEVVEVGLLRAAYRAMLSAVPSLDGGL